MTEGHGDFEKALARQKSFVTPAVITFVLYWFFYLLGLIFNIIYLREARRAAAMAGQVPSGTGCLRILLFLGFLPLVLIRVVLFARLR